MNEDLYERNARVEADKAWETSRTRRLLIAAFTYSVAFLYMSFLGVENAQYHAAVPTGGYLLSTLSLGLVKSFWITQIYRP